MHAALLGSRGTKIAPDLVGHESGSVGVFTVAHPCWEGEEEDDADGEERCGLCGANAGEIGAKYTRSCQLVVVR
jgi:hypothetical protein